jgi:uncharacterized protein YjbI with pentapeptide repeats
LRILHQPVAADAVDLAWTFRTAPARSGALFVLCGSLLVSFGPGKPKRAETERGAAHRAAPRKPAGDFLVKGCAVPPPGTPDGSRAVRVAIELNGRRKELAVFGDRAWIMGALGLAASEPVPFTSIPITYDRAFGGAGNARNPIGRGMGPGLNGNLLPNVEYLDRRVTQPTSRPEPAGFGPLDPQWQPRAGKLGSFDEAWLASNWPLMPDDFDPSFWNEAPPDQQFPGGFRGDEALAFENMRAGSPRFEARLPGLRARAFAQLSNGRCGEIRLMLDTIDVDVDAGQAELVWRGSIPVRSPRYKELAYLFTLAEPLAAQSDEATWRAMFEAARRARYPTPEERAADGEQKRAERESQEAERQAKVAASRAEALATLDAAKAKTKAATEAAGHKLDTKPPDPQVERKSIEAVFAQMRAKQPDKAASLDASLAKVLATHDRVAKLQEKWSRERLVAAHQAKADMSDADLSNLDLSGLDLSDAHLARAKFAGALLAGVVLRGADLTGCSFADANATNADFSGARLTEAVFREAVLAGARFAGAEVTKADFREAQGAAANFDGAHGLRAQFDEATLDGASFRKAQLPRASFAKARITHASFAGATLTQSDFAHATGELVCFVDADLGNLRAPNAVLSGARLMGASGVRSVWRMAKLTGADFSRALLTRAVFAEADLDQAVFDRARLEDASFDDATMQRAILTNANLLRASFARADLGDADVRSANLYRAGLFSARASRTRFEGSLVAGTLLAP